MTSDEMAAHGNSDMCGQTDDHAVVLLDHAAPVGIGRRQAEAEEARARRW